MSKVWFITGVSRGLGRAWAIAALERGDRVAGTARDLSTVADIAAKYRDDFLPLQLDVTNRDVQLHPYMDQNTSITPPVVLPDLRDLSE